MCFRALWEAVETDLPCCLIGSIYGTPNATPHRPNKVLWVMQPLSRHTGGFRGIHPKQGRFTWPSGELTPRGMSNQTFLTLGWWEGLLWHLSRSHYRTDEVSDYLGTQVDTGIIDIVHPGVPHPEISLKPAYQDPRRKHVQGIFHCNEFPLVTQTWLFYYWK